MTAQDRLADRFGRRCSLDPVLAAEAEAFRFGDWQPVDGGIEKRAGKRTLRVEMDAVIIRHDDWPGAKRIPLG